MARQTALYEVTAADSDEVLSRHGTRQATVDAWRTQATGRPVRIYRTGIPNSKVLVVEGTWHESQRQG